MFKLNLKRAISDEKILFSQDGQKLALANDNGYPRVWDIATQRDITPQKIKKTSEVAFSPDSSILATLNKDGIYMWQLETDSKKKHTLITTDIRGFDNHLSFSPDGTILLGTGMDMWSTPIKLWHVDTGVFLGELSGHTENVESLIFSHDGKTLASCSQDGTVLLWDWDKVSTKLKSEHLEGNITNVLIPVPDPIIYTGKEEEAAAVLNWLNDNGYQIQRIQNGYRVTHNGSTSTISGGGGSMRVKDVTINVDRSGILNIRVEVGTASFTFDDEGKLKYKQTDND